MAHRNNSWIIRDRKTKEGICEIWNPKLAKKKTKEKYEIVTALQHLQELNAKIKKQS